MGDSWDRNDSEIVHVYFFVGQCTHLHIVFGNVRMCCCNMLGNVKTLEIKSMGNVETLFIYCQGFVQI